MSNNASETPASNDDPSQSTDGQEQQQDQQQSDPKPSETVDFWKTKAREQEKRAKANADAAKRLTELEDANKTESEKQAGRIAQLEKDLARAQRESLKARVQARHGISDEDADLFLTGEDEDTLTRQAERLGTREDERMKNGNHVPAEGRTPNPPKPDERRAFADYLTGRTP